MIYFLSRCIRSDTVYVFGISNRLLYYDPIILRVSQQYKLSIAHVGECIREAFTYEEHSAPA